MPQNTDVSLTPRQVQLLNTIAEFRDRRGYSPTIGELSKVLCVSRTTAFGHIEQLRRKGLVSHRPGRARSLTPSSKARRLLSRIVERPQESTDRIPGGIPLVGVVAAGRPVEAVENQDCISLDPFFGATSDIFALEVRGDSMEGDDICEGDYVICRRTSKTTDGQLVVALVDNDNATLKRFYREPGRARLQSANEDYEPIYSSDCQIQGVVIGLFRKI